MAYTGQIIQNPVSGERITFLQTAADTDGELLEFELELAADGHVPGAHVHPEQEERFHVLEGTMKFRLGMRTIVAEAGESVVVPAGRVHKFANGGDGAGPRPRRGRPGAGHGGPAVDDGRARARGQRHAHGHAEAAPPGAVRAPLPARGPRAVPARLGRATR